MNENAEILGQNDVIKVEDKNRGLMPHTLFSVNDLTSKIRLEIADKGLCFQDWTQNNGMEAEVLIAGKSWRKGKLVLRIEFIPDEAPIESLLDEFRNKPNN